MFGKFVDGVFVRAPYRMSEEQAIAKGFKPVVITPAPDTDDEHYPVESLEETETEIIRHWSVEPYHVDPDPDIDGDELLDILMGGAV